jgi:hypothetical protein
MSESLFCSLLFCSSDLCPLSLSNSIYVCIKLHKMKAVVFCKFFNILRFWSIADIRLQCVVKKTLFYEFCKNKKTTHITWCCVLSYQNILQTKADTFSAIFYNDNWYFCFRWISSNIDIVLNFKLRRDRESFFIQLKPQWHSRLLFHLLVDKKFSLINQRKLSLKKFKFLVILYVMLEANMT